MGTERASLSIRKGPGNPAGLGVHHFGLEDDLAVLLDDFDEFEELGLEVVLVDEGDDVEIVELLGHVILFGGLAGKDGDDPEVVDPAVPEEFDAQGVKIDVVVVGVEDHQFRELEIEHLLHFVGGGRPSAE
jgi:hypothetical protein